MTISKSYLTSTKNLSGILEAIKTAQAPKKFSIRFLGTLDFKSNADRLIIGVLKGLGFLTPDSAAPTERYFRYLDQTQSSIVLAEGIRGAYADLFQVNINAHKMTKGDVVNKLKTLTRGDYSDSVLSLMGMTFVALCKLADFETKPALYAAESELGDEKEKLDDLEEESGAKITPKKRISFGGLHYNIQLILPESRDPRVYDALFRSLREHLYR